MSRNKTQKGFTLIEVLVAVVILSIGLLGLAGMQLWAVKNTGNAFYRTQATLAANEMVERIRANPKGVYSGVASCGSAGKSCSTGGCVPSELAGEDLDNVACGVSDALPRGQLTVACSADCTVTVTWEEIIASGKVETKQIELVVTP